MVQGRWRNFQVSALIKKLKFECSVKFIAQLNISLLLLVSNCFYDEMYFFYFKHLTVSVRFAGMFLLDYSFMSKPAFTYGFMETYHKVLIKQSTNVSETPFMVHNLYPNIKCFHFTFPVKG